VVLGSSETIALEDLPDHILASAPAEAAAGSYAAAVESAKRDAILRAFEQSGYNHDAAARALGIHPNYLHKLLRTMNMKVTVKKRGR
jgi:transcriptional regulator of acetoin/glycerol metabolism